MKNIKYIFCVMLSFIVLCTSNLSIWGHSDILDTDYDDCLVPTDSSGNIIYADGEDECWYVLNGRWKGVLTNIPYDACYHLSHETHTIKYYFADSAKDDSNYKWTTDICRYYEGLGMTEIDAMNQAEIIATEIKESYANSMKKWNNVYYVTYSEDGLAQAHKIINVEEGTKNNNNLTIYPIDYRYVGVDHKDNVTYYANCGPENWPDDIPTWEIGIIHEHYEQWEMNVNVNYYYTHGNIYDSNPEYNVSPVYLNTVNLVRERTGQHELGHILGLQDVDNLCSESSLTDHHDEILMGYGNVSRSTYAKYKDIAGVSITRGLHTDSDHVWMLRSNTDGTKDVICAQCNGVIFDIELTNGQYGGKNVNQYKSCIHHGGTNENMLLVAFDGVRDFYKCQYCRHIEEVSHTHSYVSIGDEQHTYSCSCAIIDTSGINHMLQSSNITSTHHTYGCTECDYSVTSEHDMYTSPSISPTEHGRKCRDCGYVDESTVGTHSYNSFMYVSDTAHRSTCDGCGAWKEATSPHTFTVPDRFGKMICIGCGYTKYFGSDSGNIILSITKVSANGSYILPDGTVMLVDEDIEAYLNGTLVFYDKDNVPQVQ